MVIIQRQTLLKDNLFVGWIWSGPYKMDSICGGRFGWNAVCGWAEARSHNLVLNKSKYYAVSMFAKLLVLYLQQNINSLVYI